MQQAFHGSTPLPRPEETSNPSLARFYDFLASRAVTPGQVQPAFGSRNTWRRTPCKLADAVSYTLLDTVVESILYMLCYTIHR